MSLSKNSLGPIMLDVMGHELTPEDRELLLHPGCGGVILFSRNYADPSQVTELIKSIKAVDRRELLIAVDQEGGRVQRFREGFLDLPPLASLGEVYSNDLETAVNLATTHAWLMATECRSVGVDFSFAPVLDINYGNSSVIGDRALHTDPIAVTNLAKAYYAGLKLGGMAGVAKHFPGHGYVSEDSHHELPVDNRPLDDIQRQDLLPFKTLIALGIQGVMPAHVIYSDVDSRIASSSPVWLQEILRQQLNFEGAVFSDDLSMQAAATVSISDRVHNSLESGCDMVLVCNNPVSAGEALESIESLTLTREHSRLEAMRAKSDMMSWNELHKLPAWQQQSEKLTNLKAL